MWRIRAQMRAHLHDISSGQNSHTRHHSTEPNLVYVLPLVLLLIVIILGFKMWLLKWNKKQASSIQEGNCRCCCNICSDMRLRGSKLQQEAMGGDVQILDEAGAAIASVFVPKLQQPPVRRRKNTQEAEESKSA